MAHSPLCVLDIAPNQFAETVLHTASLDGQHTRISLQPEEDPRARLRGVALLGQGTRHAGLCRPNGGLDTPSRASLTSSPTAETERIKRWESAQPRAPEQHTARRTPGCHRKDPQQPCSPSPPFVLEEKRSHYSRSSMHLPGTQRAASSLSSGFSSVTVTRRFGLHAAARPTAAQAQARGAGRPASERRHSRSRLLPGPATGNRPAAPCGGYSPAANGINRVRSPARRTPCGMTGADTGEATRPDST